MTCLDGYERILSQQKYIGGNVSSLVNRADLAIPITDVIAGVNSSRSLPPSLPYSAS